MNQLFTVPVFVLLGVLVLLIEVFSISLVGFLCFCLLLALLTQTKIDFINGYSWFLVVAVQILSMLVICGNLLTRTTWLNTSQINQ